MKLGDILTWAVAIFLLILLYESIGNSQPELTDIGSVHGQGIAEVSQDNPYQGMNYTFQGPLTAWIIDGGQYRYQ